MLWMLGWKPTFWNCQSYRNIQKNFKGWFCNIKHVLLFCTQNIGLIFFYIIVLYIFLFLLCFSELLSPKGIFLKKVCKVPATIVLIQKCNHFYLDFAGGSEVPQNCIRGCTGPHLQAASPQPHRSSPTTECHRPPMGACQFSPTLATQLPCEEILSLPPFVFLKGCFLFYTQDSWPECLGFTAVGFKLPLFWHILWWAYPTFILYSVMSLSLSSVLSRGVWFFLLSLSWTFLFSGHSSILVIYVCQCWHQSTTVRLPQAEYILKKHKMMCLWGLVLKACLIYPQPILQISNKC